MVAGGLAVVAAGRVHAADAEEEISPTEDLMREHGLLNRVLLIYDEALRRIGIGEALSMEPIHRSATVIRRFVEEYHEKQEEQDLFPRFEKAGQMTDLCAVLRKQHDAGRKLTSEILHASDVKKLRDPLRLFSRMYRPHEAREDTVLFPAFRKLMGGKELDRLGDVFEEREHKMFGEDGFEKMLDEVASIEKTLGIHDLGMFTPRA
jgi:hemerythrin-like domain-containing protein